MMQKINPNLRLGSLIFVILVLTITILSLPQSAFAITEYGINYDSEQINPFTYKWTSHPERILNSQNNYVDYLFTSTTNFLKVETAHGSVTLDKTTCSFSFYNKGKILEGQLPLFEESIIARMATNGTDNWTHVSQINNEVCLATWDGTKLEAKK